MRHRIAVRSGGFFSLSAPEPGQVDIEDIAHALAFLCRFGGHTSHFYSVAEHSVLVSQVLEQRYPHRPLLGMLGLMHDAAEAYCVDMPRPTKDLVGERYTALERRVERCIRERFDLPWNDELASEVRWADDACLLAESRVLLPQAVVSATLDLGSTVQIHCYPPGQARPVFLERFYRLQQVIDGSH